MKQTVLIVDDSAAIRKKINQIVTDNGYQVIGEAENGRLAIEQYDLLKPDIVTLDINMPETDGLEALKGIIGKYPQAKIIMCSTMNLDPVREKAYQLGAVDFVGKPFSNERFIEAIQNAMK